ncbi:MAG: hypothetical protein AB1599_11170, partial [Planctomycetota bacterium]
MFNFKFNGLLIFIFITSIILLPVTVRACEPIIPMAMLYSGTTILGAVALKSAFGLLVAVAIKCLMFCWKSELDYFTACWYMIAANIYSTVPGLLLGAAFAAPIIIIILYPVLLIPGGNIKNYNAFKSFGRFGSAGLLL